jgi:thiol-disulfide isomerase/thioredoxin
MRSTRAAFFVLLATVFAFVSAFAASSFAETSPRSKGKASTVWLVYFFASDCEKCEHVKTLIEALKAKYPVRTKSFNIDQKPNYELMQRLQAIHAKDKFAVPLVMVGETILMGEKEISAKLEGAVRKSARSGGARVPYLGQAPDRASTTTSDSACRDCEKRGRPPEIADELKKIRGFLDRWL